MIQDALSGFIKIDLLTFHPPARGVEEPLFAAQRTHTHTNGMFIQFYFLLKFPIMLLPPES